MAGLTASSRASAARRRLLRRNLSSTGSGQRVRWPANARDLAWTTPYQRRPCSAGHGRAPSGNRRRRTQRNTGEIIGEIGDLVRRHRLQHLRHGAVVAVAAVVLVFAQRLGEIVLALVGDARNVLLAGEIGVVAGVAMILLRQRLALAASAPGRRPRPAARASAVLAMKSEKPRRSSSVNAFASRSSARTIAASRGT